MITNRKLEELCIRYLKTLDPAKAAQLTGVEGDPEVEGVRLLSTRSARRILKRLTDREAVLCDAIAALMKLAYGQREGVLACDSPDLFCVSDYKLTKDGGEVKYVSRLEAIEKLCELCRNGEADRSAESFFRALGELKPSDVDE